VVAFTTPMSTWLLASFFQYIPYEVEESALMDGASRLRVLTDVIVPLLRPGMAAVGIYAFIVAWGEYMFASVFINTDIRKTLPVGLSMLIDQYRLDWGLLAAGATAITIPVIILFAFLGRRFVEGLISGSVKG
jgi:multiple sugar transport system permease protein